MTRTPEDMVREFHERFGFHVEDTPALPPEATRAERARIVAEEAAELVAELLTGLPYEVYREVTDLFAARAIPSNDPPSVVRVAGELADLTYVTAGTAVAYGVPLSAAIAEVHRANMAKVGVDGKPIYSEYHKALKPEGWQPPDIAAVLAAATPQPTPSCRWFRWVGQPLTSCDGCGRPAWEHEGDLRYGSPFAKDGEGVPYSDETREAIRRKWNPTYPATPQAVTA